MGPLPSGSRSQIRTGFRYILLRPSVCADILGQYGTIYVILMHHEIWLKRFQIPFVSQTALFHHAGAP
eukprot:s4920_g1.t1